MPPPLPGSLIHSEPQELNCLLGLMCQHVGYHFNPPAPAPTPPPLSLSLPLCVSHSLVMMTREVDHRLQQTEDPDVVPTSLMVPDSRSRVPLPPPTPQHPPPARIKTCVVATDLRWQHKPPVCLH